MSAYMSLQNANNLLSLFGKDWSLVRSKDRSAEVLFLLMKVICWKPMPKHKFTSLTYCKIFNTITDLSHFSTVGLNENGYKNGN